MQELKPKYVTTLFECLCCIKRTDGTKTFVVRYDLNYNGYLTNIGEWPDRYEEREEVIKRIRERIPEIDLETAYKIWNERDIR